MIGSQAEAQDIVAALRQGAVPSRGLHHFAVGLEWLQEAFCEELDQVARGRGRSKWIRGAYGTGKTFATRLLCHVARQRGFATAEVQVSINDTPLHRLETVYRRLMERLTTAEDGIAAFKSILDTWLYDVGEEVERLRGLAEDDPAFPAAVEERLEDKLAVLSRTNQQFAAVLRAYHRAVHEGQFGLAQGLVAWLSGQPHVDRSVTGKAGVKGAVDGQAALAFLRGVLEVLRQSGYEGLVLVLDEVETIQRMRELTREKSLNALRQLVDMLAAEELPGLYLLVTGTPDFYEGYKGLKQLQPLYQRIAVQFDDGGRYDNPRAVQVRLQPFDADRLRLAGQKVRDLFPAKHGARVADKVDDAFIADLADQVTSGFGGKVDIAPRVFLRELVNVLDLADVREDYEPREHYRLTLDDDALTPEELAALRGGQPSGSEQDEPAEPPRGGRRLDG